MSIHFAKKHYRIQAIILLFSLSLVFHLSVPSPAYAAYSSWEEALVTIDSMYDTYSLVESTNKAVKQQIQALRKENNEELKSINSRVQMMDKALLDHLKSDAESTRQKHAPLLAEYTALGKNASEARKRKDSKAAVLFDLKRNRIKGQVTTARQSIKQKQDAYNAAKKQTAAKTKLVKDALLGIPAIKKKVTAENQQISSLNKSKTSADKRYKAAIKQGDALTAGTELAIMIDLLHQIQTSQQKILKDEQSIAIALKSAEARLPD